MAIIYNSIGVRFNLENPEKSIFIIVPYYDIFVIPKMIGIRKPS
jgi:hypothetical protein